MQNIPEKIVPLYPKIPDKILAQQVEESRSIKLFENAIRSPYTRKNYRCTLKKFMAFAGIENFDNLVGLPEKEIQIILEDYVIHLKTLNLNPNSFPVMFTGLQLFFSMNDKILNWKKIKKFYPDTVKKAGYGTYTTGQIQLLLKATTDFRNRAIILFLSSTGARVGALVGLKLKHLKDMPGGCKRVIIYENSKEEYAVFLTPETSRVIDAYVKKRQMDGEDITQESPLFRDKYHKVATQVTPMDYWGLKEIVKRLVEKTGMERKRLGSRYDIQLCHGFRKRFNTILKSNSQINSNIAEKLMGHKNGLDGTYFVPTEEQLFTEFRKAIQDLTVDDSETLLVQNRKLEEELSKQATLEEENRHLKDRVKNIENDLKKVLKRQEMAKKYKKSGD